MNAETWIALLWVGSLAPWAYWVYDVRRGTSHGEGPGDARVDRPLAPERPVAPASVPPAG